MNKSLVDKVLADLNALIVDETAATDPGHYKRVMKLAAYAERIHQMDCKRVGGVTDHAGRPVMGGGMIGYDDPIDQYADDVANDANEQGMPRPIGLPLGLGGWNPGGNDGLDIMREAVMMIREMGDKTNAPKSRTAGQLSDDLQSLLDAEDRLVNFPPNDGHRAALPAIRANIEAVTKQLEEAAKPLAPKETRHVQHAPLAPAHLARAQLLRRHPPHLDVEDDVHPAQREAHAGGEPGADGVDVEGPEQGLDRR